MSALPESPKCYPLGKLSGRTKSGLPRHIRDLCIFDDRAYTAMHNDQLKEIQRTRQEKAKEEEHRRRSDALDAELERASAGEPSGLDPAQLAYQAPPALPHQPYGYPMVGYPYQHPPAQGGAYQHQQPYGAGYQHQAYWAGYQQPSHVGYQQPPQPSQSAPQQQQPSPAVAPQPATPPPSLEATVQEVPEDEAKLHASQSEQSAPAQQLPKVEPAASEFAQLMAAFKQQAAEMAELKAQLAAKGEK